MVSWADEVEKEEAEAAMAHRQVEANQKTDPFGSARPREVVLRERLIHRQNRDPNLQPPPPFSILRNESEFKENSVSEGSVAQFVSIFHHPESAIFDPPLRYPPKNVVAAALLLSSSHEIKPTPCVGYKRNRPPLVENQMLCNGTSYSRGRPNGNKIKRAEASQSMEMKQAWVRTTDTKGFK